MKNITITKQKPIRLNAARLNKIKWWTNPKTGKRMPVVDATVPCSITVTDEDWEKGVPYDIRKCAIARSNARSMGIDPDNETAIDASGLTVYWYVVHKPEPHPKYGIVLRRYYMPSVKEWDESMKKHGSRQIVLRPPPKTGQLGIKRVEKIKRLRLGQTKKRDKKKTASLKSRYAGPRQHIGWKTDRE
jgi:hypothetical protein